jgi:uncharacterized oxidoreductase
MKTTGNTILITGGGTGIGRGLAEAFHARGNQIIIASRRREALDETTASHPGMASYVVDLQDPVATRDFALRVAREHPTLNVLINNSGIMRAEDLLDPDGDLTDMEAIVATNLLGPLRLSSALLPHLRKQARSALMNVSSGLAFVPLALTPTYCATKAALHSYTQSLRYQLKGSSTEVLELIPPYVATHLMNGADDPRAMPLAAFIQEVMTILETEPDAFEICVENVKRLRFAAETGKYEAVFQGFNDAMAANPH